MINPELGKTGIKETTLDKLVHVHIPKTAGTSVRRTLADFYGDDQVLHLNPVNDTVLPLSRSVATGDKPAVDVLKRIAYRTQLNRIALPVYKMLRKIEQDGHDATTYLQTADYNVVSGHIPADMIPVYGLSGLPIVSLVRDPLERSFSHYQHWQRTHAGVLGAGTSGQPVDSFEAFLDLPTQANYQSRYLAGLSLQHVATIETAPQLMEELGITGRIPRLNAAPHATPVPLGHTARQAYEERNRADYELVTAIQESWA